MPETSWPSSMRVRLNFFCVMLSACDRLVSPGTVFESQEDWVSDRSLRSDCSWLFFWILDCSIRYSVTMSFRCFRSLVTSMLFF